MLHALNANNSVLAAFSFLDHQWAWSIKTSLLYTCVGYYIIKADSDRTRLEHSAETFASGLGVSRKIFAVPHNYTPELLMHRDALSTILTLN